MKTISKEDIEKIEKFIELKSKGYYADGGQVTELYNRILDRHVNPTSCGSCIRQRITELEDYYKKYKEDVLKASESISEPQPTTTKEEENKAVKKENKKVKK